MSTRQEDLELELRDVVIALKDVAGTQWYDLGLQLKLSPSILDTIAAHHNVDDHKRMMLRKWLQSDAEASWERLAVALTLTGYKATAASVRRQFVKVAVQATAETAAQSEEDEIRIALTQRNLQKIKGQFSALLRKVQSALESSQVNIEEVHDFLVRYFSRDVWIQSPSTFGELFNVLSVVKLWNYDHYGPLELIITHFLSDNTDIEACMTDYISKLTGFYTATKIADFIKLSDFEDSEQDPQQPLPMGNFTLKDYRRLKLKLKLNRKVSTVTLSYVDELWRSLAKQFDLPCLTAVIHSIVKGSLELTWLVLPHIAEKIVVNSRNSEAVKFFRRHGIILAEIGDNHVYDEEQMTEHEKQLFEICRKNINVSSIGKLVSCGVDINTFHENGLSPLYIAIGMGHFEIAKELLRYGAQVNLVNNDSSGDIPLTIACARGNADIVMLLIDSGAIVNFQNKLHGTSPLRVTCQENHPHIAKLLLERGAQVDMIDKKLGISALHFSSRNGRNELVQVLLDYHAEVNLLSDDKLGNTPLIEACQNRHAETARILLDHGAAVDYCNKEGNSSLHISSRSGYDEVVEVLLKYGAQVNLPMRDEWGDTALIEACLGGHVETARILLDHGANVDYQNGYGRSALLCASDAGKTECVKVLVKYGAQVDLPDEGGDTALMIACRHGHVETARILLHHGANVDHQNKNGQTILYIASGLNRLEIVKLLLEYRAQVNKANNDSNGDIPLTSACAYGNADIVMLLIDSGAIVNFQNKRGATPLHVTCINGHSHIAKLLIERGADIDVQMKDQSTPLFQACFKGHLETVNVLLKAGAQPDIPRENGLTGLMVACQKGMADIAKALLEARADTGMTEESTGRMALFFAAEQGYVEIIKLLIIHGADVDIKDKTGATAADVAKVNSHQDICDMLQQHSNQEKNTELSKEQKLEVKSVGSRVRNIFNILEETFLSERVRKREHQMQKEQQYQENRMAMTEIEFLETPKQNYHNINFDNV